MQILLAVIDDLFQFACTALFGSTPVSVKNTHYEVFEIESPSPQLQLPSFQSVGKLLEERVSPVENVLSLDKTWHVGEEGVSVFYEPVFAFDSAVCELPYGTPVHVRKLGGRWAEVTALGVEGWVLKDSLREDVDVVFPHLILGTVYEAENPETIKLRKYIGDMFSGHLSLLPLFDTEFVTYRLSHRGQHIPWSHERPRIAGTWQKLLRGKSGVYIGIAPRAGSVMEYLQEDIGHVCFVEAVYPDMSIKISSVGIHREGEYTETVLSHDEWKELRPVFINLL